jgi:hypothetical protein
MLTPVILSKIYTKEQLISKLADKTSTLDAMSDNIVGINEPNLSIQYGSNADKVLVEQEIEAIVEALQILGSDMFGNDLLKPNVKYVY